MSLPKLNPVEPPWYGPVCPVVGEGWHREVSPYPDLCPTPAVRNTRRDRLSWVERRHSRFARPVMPRLNPVEPPWYGPVCPVVGEGWHREVPPYPDPRRVSPVAPRRREGPLTEPTAGAQKRDPANTAAAEQSLQAAIAIAQSQKARSFELRAALFLAKLYRAANRGADAHTVLAPAVEDFPPTQQFPELAEAQTLLSALNP